MKVYVTKQNRKKIDFVLLEADNKFVRKSSGKVGESGITNSTLNAGSPDKAIAETGNQVDEYRKQGFSITDLPSDLITKDIVFDKAKWHINDQFPTGLDQYQSYVHTGLYLAWLIVGDFIEPDFKADNREGIKMHLSRQLTPVKFYELQLDGVFDANVLTQEAIKFTAEYFDFKKGQYIIDYLSILDPEDNLPSLFHISDSWENYDKLKPVLDRRFKEWRKNNSH